MAQFIKKIFGKKPQPAEITDTLGETAPLKEPPDGLGSSQITKPIQLDEPITVKLDLPQLVVGCGHSVGKQREHNEDALITLTTNLISDTKHFPFGMYIVADGMGGHQHGEVASSIAVRAMANHILVKLYLPLLGPKATLPEESIQEIMQKGVMEAHRAIVKDALGGGTTLTAVLILGNQMTVTHVGDSRAYVIYENGRMEVLTHDHSLVKRLEELGQITEEEAAHHPQRNVLYRALGQGDPFEPDVSTFPIPPSGYLLICSDGLWGVIPKSEILEIIHTAPDPQQASQILTDAANEAGGPDNISVILVRLPD